MKLGNVLLLSFSSLQVLTRKKANSSELSIVSVFHVFSLSFWNKAVSPGDITAFGFWFTLTQHLFFTFNVCFMTAVSVRLLYHVHDSFNEPFLSSSEETDNHSSKYSSTANTWSVCYLLLKLSVKGTLTLSVVFRSIQVLIFQVQAM